MGSSEHPNSHLRSLRGSGHSRSQCRTFDEAMRRRRQGGAWALGGDREHHQEQWEDEGEGEEEWGILAVAEQLHAYVGDTNAFEGGDG